MCSERASSHAQVRSCGGLSRREISCDSPGTRGRGDSRLCGHPLESNCRRRGRGRGAAEAPIGRPRRRRSSVAQRAHPAARQRGRPRPAVNSPAAAGPTHADNMAARRVAAPPPSLHGLVSSREMERRPPRALERAALRVGGLLRRLHKSHELHGHAGCVNTVEVREAAAGERDHVFSSSSALLPFRRRTPILLPPLSFPSAVASSSPAPMIAPWASGTRPAARAGVSWPPTTTTTSSTPSLCPAQVRCPFF